MAKRKVVPGCEMLAADPPPWLSKARLGLVAHQASVDRSLTHVKEIVARAGGNLRCLFSPQHGFHGEKQANMVESDHGRDPDLDIPIYSLYGEVRRPTPEMLSSIDVLLVDLQDVGTRVYTYGATLGLCLEAAAEEGIPMVVLDRPNPVGGYAVEGNLLREDHRSFVGLYPLPMRHGFTPAELALYVARQRKLDCDLRAVPLHDWSRSLFFPGTSLPWVPPSPNMPSWETALLYPGMVLLEGCNLSEGRGTTLPFHLFGAPFIDPKPMLRLLEEASLQGVAFRPVRFEPVFDKWAGAPCNGFQIHVTKSTMVRPYRLGLTILRACLELYPRHFRWLPPPYEYERRKLPIDILLGDGNIRKKLEAGTEILDIEEDWREELESFDEKRLAYWLY